nr:insulin degrading enzyme [Hymenolepis microstoma]
MSVYSSQIKVERGRISRLFTANQLVYVVDRSEKHCESPFLQLTIWITHLTKENLIAMDYYEDFISVAKACIDVFECYGSIANVTKSQEDEVEWEDVKITKSENDNRLYLSDSQTDKAAACLAVAVGSFTDPVEIPGLAHFCEHMILLGSEKYPEENGYAKFVTSHCGSLNAFTTPTETCYVFDVAPEYLYESLERFSNLFESPLFTESATEREVNAVDSEHEKNYTSDTRRILQVDKLLSSQEHDYAKFSTGNKMTLFDSLREKSINVRDELIKFHAKYYSSNIMAVTIISNEPLDEMEKKYAPLFINIPNLNISPKTWSSTPWTKECLQKKISIVPVRNAHELRLLWPISDYTEFYKASPTNYLTHLLGHESAGSLLSELKRQQLATALVTEFYRPGSGFASIILHIEPTDQGLEKVDEIITLVFQYINMLKQEGFQQWVLEEEKDSQALKFRFKGKEDPFEYVCKLSPRMFKYPPADILTAGYLISEFRPDLIEEIMNCITPENFRYFIISKKVADSCNRIEQYYKTPFGCESIPLEKIKVWKNCGLNGALHLPPKNLYMPTEFSLKCELNPDHEDSTLGPRVIEEAPGSLLWFKQDSKFKLPKSYICFNLISPILSQDPMRDLMLELFEGLFLDSVNENTYQYSLAGLNFEIPTAPPTLRLMFAGYSHKMPLLVENTVNALMQFTNPDKERFDVLLRKLELNVKNFTSCSALEQADHHMVSVLFDRCYQHEDRVAAVEQITYEDILQFITTFFNSIYVEILVYGNEDTEGALKYKQIMIDALKKYTRWRPPVSCPSPHMREVEIPTGQAHTLKQINRSNEISAIRIYYQNQPINAENRAIHRLFEQIIHQPAFNKLRTDKQLGYIVASGWHWSNSFQGIYVFIQSKYHPRDLDDHIEEFMASVEEMLENMSDKEFEEHKESVRATLLLKPKTMNQQCIRYWGQIVRQIYDFDLHAREVEVIKGLQKADVQCFYRTYIKATSEARRKFAVYVTSEKAPVTDKEDLGIVIENPTEFKRILPLRPIAVPRRHTESTKTSATQ